MLLQIRQLLPHQFDIHLGTILDDEHMNSASFDTLKEEFDRWYQVEKEAHLREKRPVRSRTPKDIYSAAQALLYAERALQQQQMAYQSLQGGTILYNK